MAHAYRGTKGQLSEIQTDNLSGGLAADKFVTTDSTAKLAGRVLLWDAAGNVASSTIQGNAGQVQMAAGTPIAGFVLVYDANGNAVPGAGPPATGSGTTGVWAEEIPAGTLNGTNRVFTLSNAPVTGTLELFLNVAQREGTDFSIAGATITFAVAPKAADAGWFYARYEH